MRNLSTLLMTTVILFNYHALAASTDPLLKCKCSLKEITVGVDLLQRKAIIIDNRVYEMINRPPPRNKYIRYSNCNQYANGSLECDKCDLPYLKFGTLRFDSNSMTVHIGKGDSAIDCTCLLVSGNYKIQ
ncbi:MAG: hypothetical protein HQK53_12705 [Oligoflexia bacterium]|nr:hypothetical protein [Oligoflexia bacterium]